LDAAAFDDENYYRMGDAIEFVDSRDVLKGFVFDGRLNEDFKLSSGTWVRASSLRMRLLAHFGSLLQDVVLAGPDRDYVTALLFPSASVSKDLCAHLPENPLVADVLGRPEIRELFQERLDTFAALNGHNSTCVVRAILLDVPPSMEAREITDKGSVNQSAVLKNRAELVFELYKEPAPASVLVIREGRG
jgi:feruloyl-CoA synthase